MDMQTSLATAQDALASRTIKAPVSKGLDAARTQKAAQDFESMFIAQMLQPMFNTVEVDETFGGGEAEEMWRGMMVEEMAKDMASKGGLGIAPIVQKEMMRLQEVADGSQ